MLTVGLIACMHGNEILGKQVADQLPAIEGVEVLTFLANPEAYAKGVRYLEKDMNRCFPGDPHGALEERLAHSLLHKLAACDWIIDIHTTMAATDSFVIAVEHTPLVDQLVAAVPLDKVVYMTGSLASGQALINHKPGISIEFADVTSLFDALNVVTTTLHHWLQNKHHDKQAFRDVCLLEGSQVYDNFMPIQHQGKTLYPILSGETAYANTACILCETI